MADDQGLNLDPEDEARFEAWFTKRQEEEERKKNRSKTPKDFAEFMDRLADRVWERGEERAAERRKAEEDADQEPTRGKGMSAIERFWSGDKGEKAG